MKKPYRYGILLVLLAAGLTSCGRKSFEEQVAIQLQEFTEKQCPQKLDDFTTLDSMSFDQPNNTINYYYTFSGQLDNPDVLTNGVLEDFKEDMILKLHDDLKLKEEKQHGITFAYHYLSRSTRKPLVEFVFTKEEYGKKIVRRSFNYKETRNCREYTAHNCPVRQDEATTLDSMWYDSISRTITYDYSLSGHLDNDSLFLSPDITKEQKKQLIQSIKSNKEIDYQRDVEKLNFAFRYFSSTTRKLLLNITLKNEDLK
ncbi:MAG: hypothetical protein KBT12_07275 [Bacteroidales bacterium]|nr:hypothetical protein [Candidatus Physcousia equi]